MRIDITHNLGVNGDWFEYTIPLDWPDFDRPAARRICNRLKAYGNVKPLAIDGAAYRRRTKRRR